MGIQDRKYYREKYRNASPTNRERKSPSTGRVAMFWIAVMAITFAAFRLAPTNWPHTPSALPPPVAAPPVQTAPQAPPRSPAAVRPAPFEASRAAPIETSPIYRCGNRYSNEPCAGGRAIDGAIASGFDSRPSERLARLVAEGRTVDNDSVTTNSRTTTTTSRTVTTGGGVGSGSAISGDSGATCRALAAAIDAIDREARRPLTAPGQDDLRGRRRALRDQQIAWRC